MILVTHDPRIVDAFCDRGILMEAGRIVAEGSGAEIACRYQDSLTAPAARAVKTSV